MREEIGIIFALVLIGFGWVGFLAGADWLLRFAHRRITQVRRGMERKA